jgi:hypothetical protein
MPFDPKNPPDKVKNLSPEKQRQWVHIFNSCWSKDPDERKCHMQAWGAVKKRKGTMEKEATPREWKKSIDMANNASWIGRKKGRYQFSATPFAADGIKKDMENILKRHPNFMGIKVNILKKMPHGNIYEMYPEYDKSQFASEFVASELVKIAKDLTNLRQASLTPEQVVGAISIGLFTLGTAPIFIQNWREILKMNKHLRKKVKEFGRDPVFADLVARHRAGDKSAVKELKDYFKRNTNAKEEYEISKAFEYALA